MSLGVGLDSASFRDTSFVQPKPYLLVPRSQQQACRITAALPEAQSRRDGVAAYSV